MTYIEHFLYIRTKEGAGELLRPKPAQMLLHKLIASERAAGRPPRIVTLKARQTGMSTWTEAEFFKDTATRRMVQTLIVAHRDDSTSNLFRMNKLFLDALPPPLKPMVKASNAKELLFENPTRDAGEKARAPGLRSRIRCVTAGDGVGRSDTLTNVHISEYAFWKGDKKSVLDGILQAVPYDVNTCVVIESTANGFEEFKAFWDAAVAGENGFVPLFLPWFTEPDYRMAVEPDTVWTEAEEKLRSAHGLDDEQLAWRRWCIKTNLGGDEQAFRQEYPSTPLEAFLLSGTPFFEPERVMEALDAAPEPLHIGNFTFSAVEPSGRPSGETLQEDARGCVRIWREPEAGVPYVMGGDTAGDGSDRSTAWVIDNRTGEQVAELQTTDGEIEYTRQLYCLGKLYGFALAAVEVNYSTYPERMLEAWDYPKLYVRERMDGFTNRLQKTYGYVTSAQTRPVMLSTLWRLMHETPQLVKSAWTLREMLRFIYNDRRRPEAAPGEHDDLVFACGIAHMARDQQQRTADVPIEARAWREDQWEDYANADEAGKAYLRSIWGNPS